MADRKRVSLVQQAITQEMGGSYLSGNGGSWHGWSPDLPFHFTLDLDSWDEDVTRGPDIYVASEQIASAPHLDAGKKYRLLASGSTTGLANQGDLTITTAIELKAGCPGCTQVTIEDPIRSVPYPPDPLIEHVFKLSVEEQSPILDELIIELRYRMVDSKSTRWMPLKTLVVALNGTFDPDIFCTVVGSGIALPKHSTHPPANLVFLTVTEPQVGRLSVTAGNRFKQKIFDELDELPKSTLANFIKDRTTAEKVRGEMNGISRYALPKLRNWLRNVWEKCRGDLDVLVFDYTDHQFPWEMLELNDGWYLGAKARVARWIPIQDFSGFRALSLSESDPPPEFVGTVLAYVDSENMQGASCDITTLDQIEAERCESMTDFSKRLRGTLDGIGLLYLGCHGMFSYDDKSRIYAGTIKGQREYPLTLEGARPNRAARPLAFVNACHSGRLKSEGSRLYGLPEVFLVRDVDGYIGTLGPIGSDFAGTVLDRLAADLKTETTGIEPAEFLRSLRAQVVQESEIVGADEDARLAFVYVFMYVYYGHPHARLRLSQKREEQVSA